jgi:exonuclease III
MPFSRISLMSWNVRGIKPTDKHPRKTHDILSVCCKADVVALQETHLDEANLDYVKTIIGGRQSVLSAGSGSRMGVALIAIKPTINIVERHFVSDRTLVAEISEYGQRFTIMVAYAPTGTKERRNYFSNDLLPLIVQYEPDLLCGDFNCVLRAVDTVGFASPGTEGAPALRAALQQGQLSDAALARSDVHPGFTFVVGAGATAKARRLDMIFAKRTLINVMEHNILDHSGVSDHHPVLVKFCAGRQGDAGLGLQRIWPHEVRTDTAKAMLSSVARHVITLNHLHPAQRLSLFRLAGVYIMRSLRQHKPPLSDWMSSVKLLALVEKEGTLGEDEFDDGVITTLRDHVRQELVMESVESPHSPTCAVIPSWRHRRGCSPPSFNPKR